MTDQCSVPTLASLADKVGRGALDPVGLAEDALDQAEASSSVFITITRERALREAHLARERARARLRLSSLDGLPLAWKDLFDLIGTRTTAGSATRDAVPLASTDAPCLAAVRRAGLVTIGKTNLSEFAFSGLGINPHFGTSSINSDSGPRVPGGSSSGSARAVALGIVPAAIGTDTAGSVRIPAAFNGLVGFKASRERYDRRGVFALAPTFDSIGPIARSVEDCVLLDAALRGRVEEKHEPGYLARTTFVVEETVLHHPAVQEPVRANLHAMLERIARRTDATVRVAPVAAIGNVRSAIDRDGWPGAAEAFIEHEARLAGPDRLRMDPRIVERLDQAATMPLASLLRLYRTRSDLQRCIVAELGGAILVLPTVAHVAPALDPLLKDSTLFAATNLATLRLTMLTSFLDMPSLALPTGTDTHGLFTSLQLCLPEGEDDRLLGLGLAVEYALAA